MAEIIIPVGIVFLVMCVPIISILTRHQQKMASIIHANKGQGMSTDTERRLESEIAELRQMVTQQAILVDDLQSMHRRLLERSAESDTVRNRLGN